MKKNRHFGIASLAVAIALCSLLSGQAFGVTDYGVVIHNPNFVSITLIHALTNEDRKIVPMGQSGRLVFLDGIKIRIQEVTYFFARVDPPIAYLEHRGLKVSVHVVLSANRKLYLADRIGRILNPQPEGFPIDPTAAPSSK